MKVFVYGTLMSGYGNNRLLVGSTFLGKANTWTPYEMISLGGFPAVVQPDVGFAGTQVHGELYEVDANTLQDLDRLEGHPHFYRRRLVWIEQGADMHEAWIYMVSGDQYSGRPVVNGDWRDHRRTHDFLQEID